MSSNKPAPSGEPILTMRGIEKSFGAEVKALKGVDFEVRPGEIIALLGENGAGKSTLLKAITGVHTPTAGEVRWFGEPVVLDSPSKARGLGIRTVYQELNLAPHLSVAANIYLGAEPMKSGLLDHKAMREKAQTLLTHHGFDLNPDALVGTLGPAQRQAVEICKALSEEAKLLLLDEPTSSLGEKEIEELFTTLKALRERGIGMVFVSHRLPECFALCDRVVVLRDGLKVYEANISETDTSTVVRAMVGRELSDFYPRVAGEPGPERLKVSLDGVEFATRAGEVVGIAGLMGAGRTELLEAIFGLRHMSGSVVVDGKPLPLNQGPRVAIKAGVGMLTEDRKRTGLALGLPVRHNVTLAGLEKIAPGPWLAHGPDKAATKTEIKRLRIKTSSTETLIGTLSGGNQQKGVLGRWLHAGSSVLLFDEPTRGVDVGSKVEIYEQMNALTQDGATIVLVSSELPELLGMSDRILVLFQGHLVANITRLDATPDRVLHFMMTGKDIQ
ncbi:sugar ABC transporter ATP-binding protein [Armatimonas sp.]|uniref:sugar ABC transporter ATP-binding protein n=1 Tax=Armatimonas sp. TaxID=1872638 RepID=UPI00286B4C85|nr:sugar ABC transporter ATP-binding protein [Armatimonas sp.]